MVNAAANELLTAHDGRKVPRVAVDAPVARVKVQERAIPIGRRRLRVDLDDLRPELARTHPRRPAHGASDPVASDDDSRPEVAGARLDDRAARRVVADPLDAHPVADVDPSRRRGPGERVVELDSADDAADAAGTRDRLAVAAPERDAVHPRARDVDLDVELAQQRVAASSERARARFVARVARLLEEHHPPREVGRGLGEGERGRRPGRAAAHDHDSRSSPIAGGGGRRPRRRRRQETSSW